ncbi:hypothetical protein NWI01_04730 [Nitrobacter winogradskyi]|uniref:Uncharacterized protein n=2 Tax=Nitrobacter winogradskyi TaxID=913 RepID=A0A4Y3W944_NITWI|nr:hypothetical protein NWI01_04730 [Nitrobacter winogradskyi]
MLRWKTLSRRCSLEDALSKMLYEARDAMADRNGLKIVGALFATVMLVVTLATWTVVKGYADGVYSFESAAVAHIAPR